MHSTTANRIYTSHLYSVRLSARRDTTHERKNSPWNFLSLPWGAYRKNRLQLSASVFRRACADAGEHAHSVFRLIAASRSTPPRKRGRERTELVARAESIFEAALVLRVRPGGFDR